MPDHAVTLVAFDLDGTLLDCGPRQVAVAAHLAGPGFDGDAFWAAKRHGATTHAALEAQGVAADRAADIAAHWVATVEDDAWLPLDPPLPAARATLAAARDAGWRTAIVTARRRADAVRTQIARVGLLSVADVVVVVDPAHAAPRKAEVLVALGAVAYVGDTESDARAAELAGVPFAAVGCGQRAPAWLIGRGIAPVHSDAAAALEALLAARRSAR